MICQRAVGQAELPKIIPHSPTAASLFKYLDYPVDQSTGVPQISVPLYEITSGSLTVPISINYHASGRKVNDQDGAIALGWSLQAGGMISRTIYGSPDLGPQPFPNPFNFTISFPADLGYLERISHYPNNPVDAPPGLWVDTEYDIFSYNFNGTSGKFLLKDNNNVKTPVLLPEKPYIITPRFANNFQNGFTITDDKGTTYEFTPTDTYGTAQQSATSGYSLTRIISADKTDTITFTYSAFYEERVSINQQIILNDKVNVSQQHQPFEVPQITDVENTARDGYQVSRLSTINFKNGKVVFNLLPGTDKINNIQILNAGNEIIKTIQFTRSVCYTQPELNSIRHKLDEIQFRDKNNSTIEKYAFEYYPVVSQNGQIDIRHADYWGYYNASGIHDMVPYYTGLQYQANISSPIYNTSSVGNPGFNRTPDLEATKSGVLKKITLPTGGSTEFIYDQNFYYSYADQQGRRGPGLRIAQIIKEDRNGTSQSRVFKYGESESGYGAIDMEPKLQTMASESYYQFTPVDTEGDWTRSGSYRQRVFYSGFIAELSDIADRPVIYNQVTEYHGTVLDNVGKTIYEYDNYAWAPAGMPLSTSLTIGRYHISNFNYWNPPALTKQTDYLRTNVGYDTHYSKRKEVTNVYLVSNTEMVTGLHLQRVHAFPQTGTSWSGGHAPEKHVALTYGINPYAWSPYQVPSGSKKLTQSVEQLYNEDQSVITKTTTYNYNAKHLLSKSTRNTSDGGSLVTETKYPFEYPGNNILDLMTTLNMLNFPIEQLESRNTQPVKSVRTNYDNWGTTSPMLAPRTVEIKKGNLAYETRLRYLSYDNDGNPLNVSKETDVPMAYVWDYNKSYPVAEVTNAADNEIAFTSFEADGTGNWTGINVANINQSIAVTGSASYNFNGTTISKPGLSTTKNYIVSYWTQTGPCTVSGTPVAGWPRNIRSVTINGTTWTCWEHQVTNTSTVAISGSGTVDELRLFPAAAQMTSHCYKPLIGMLTQNDPNNQILYYEYDNAGRLKLIRDMDNNIIKTITYQYQTTTP
ncbi:hypothetical protein [Paraflavitalea sp. CAU 1676]|uniref:hypothetical protein n=1 Tax=Paraflavitalea sp. CAU 1676 TaxID=3032598 RepID=UPI0023D9BB28|nr:hypothetical protein [Paraflavitalea sp. CAU 1676]MDF2191563.1 hypothetical protein [Paraflavitalea sp. CAU 1676]